MCLQDIMYMVCLLVENVALSSDDNEELVYCLKVGGDLLAFPLGPKLAPSLAFASSSHPASPPPPPSVCLLLSLGPL